MCSYETAVCPLPAYVTEAKFITLEIHLLGNV